MEKIYGAANYGPLSGRIRRRILNNNSFGDSYANNNANNYSFEDRNGNSFEDDNEIV